VSLAQFFRILYARRLILIISLVTCLATAVAMIQVLPKRYSAHARVMLDIIKPDPVTGQVIGTQFLRAYTRTQIELIKDYQIAELVVDKLGWANNPELVQQYSESGDSGDIRRWLARQIIDGTEAHLIEPSNILEISYTSPRPETSKLIVTLIRDAYIHASFANRQETTGRTADWFRDQVTQAEALVKAAEAERAEFAKAHGIVLQADNTDLESSRLKALSGQSAVEVVAPGMAASAPSSPSQAQLEMLTQQIEQAAAALGPNHPTLQSLQRQRIALERIVARDRAAAPAGSPAGGARANIDAAYNRQKGIVVEQSENIDMINRMTRNIELKRDQLAKISDRASEVRLQANLGDTGISRMGDAVAPDQPEFPNVPLIIIGAFGFSGALGVGLSLLIELLGRRIRSQEDLEYAARSPVFAEIAAKRKRRNPVLRKVVRYLTDRARKPRPAVAGAE
jgi:uncharacterized protein involved in exopolysaccharide biosynthesis